MEEDFGVQLISQKCVREQSVQVDEPAREETLELLKKPAKRNHQGGDPNTLKVCFDKRRECVHQRIVELVDVEVQQLIRQRTVEQIEAPLVKVVFEERKSDRIVEQFVEIFVSHFGKEIVEVVRWIAEQIVGVPVLQNLKENDEVLSLVPHGSLRSKSCRAACLTCQRLLV